MRLIYNETEKYFCSNLQTQHRQDATDVEKAPEAEEDEGGEDVSSVRPLVRKLLSVKIVLSNFPVQLISMLTLHLVPVLPIQVDTECFLQPLLVVCLLNDAVSSESLVYFYVKLVWEVIEEIVGTVQVKMKVALQGTELRV